MRNHLTVGVFSAAFIVLLFMAFRSLPESTTPLCLQCCDCEPNAKTENSVSEDYDELYLEEDEIITEIWIKSGDGCYVPDGTCYAVLEGGVGYNFVRVERVGDGPACQGISHLEVCYDEVTPINTPTETEEIPTNTNTPEEPTATYTSTITDTPKPEETDTPDPIFTPTSTPTPWPTLKPPPRGRG